MATACLNTTLIKTESWYHACTDSPLLVHSFRLWPGACRPVRCLSVIFRTLLTSHRVYESQEPCSSIYDAQTIPMLQSRLAGIDRRVKTELEAQGFKPDQIKTEKVLHMRFDGSDTSLMMYVR